MTKIYLLRHGETEWNASGNRYCGLTDIELSDNGKKQAKLAAGYLKEVPFHAAYSSPLCRAYETARIIANEHRLSVEKDERIIEADFGLWEGKPKEQFIEEDPQAWRDWLVDPGTARAGKTGETAEEIYRRAKAFFTEIADKHKRQTILVVAHNTVNRFFIAGSLGIPFRNYRRILQDNTGITVFEKDGEVIKFLNINLNAHLE
ncbi:histidine phosphatase family protein [Paenactinomyces guangxiensis]|uniref:Histidine phosphatase family protein n=1 Tax=Paenactinomyces guangxiensis TaxID=1490290 RepID=A0A7W1WP84_9BACL|nr:histidine phosphatase family protein [Paenactinomyces guangxiensis]MBA4493521.1 histidine phosphatase family protein [Paenactinomyces guangxiensis]MBH8590612.1 histidine phosphatase family protein [Paenactinomyces guangxiensis]